MTEQPEQPWWTESVESLRELDKARSESCVYDPELTEIFRRPTYVDTTLPPMSAIYAVDWAQISRDMRDDFLANKKAQDHIAAVAKSREQVGVFRTLWRRLVG